MPHTSAAPVQVKVVQGAGLSGVALWSMDGCGYAGGVIEDADFQQMCARWLQFAAFVPLMRLHGKRVGGPPADVCGETYDDNELWTIFSSNATEYGGSAAMLHLREALRPYVSAVNAVSASTGTPMVRAMILECNDPPCAEADAEDQFMFGPDWLVAPMYVPNTTSRSVYLPTLPQGSEWVHWFTRTVSPSGTRVDVEAPVSSFPLFYRSPPLLSEALPAILRGRERSVPAGE